MGRGGRGILGQVVGFVIGATYSIILFFVIVQLDIIGLFRNLATGGGVDVVDNLIIAVLLVVLIGVMNHIFRYIVRQFY